MVTGLPANLCGEFPLRRTNPIVEQMHFTDHVRSKLSVAYDGIWSFTESELQTPADLNPMTDELARWVSSTLVTLADLPFSFVHLDENED
jgi:hypothetical protein